MSKFLAGLILGLIVIPLGVYLYFSTGSAPVATAAQAMPFEKMLARKALHVRVEKEMPKDVPLHPDEANLAAGAQLYVQNCAVCHGLPGQPTTAIANGMYPSPPTLLEGKGVTDDPPGESYWKIANGIRMTGMPAFDKSMDTTQMWQVSLLIANADKLPDSVKSGLKASRIP
jgi:thiosulfate dehydrogenase